MVLNQLAGLIAFVDAAGGLNKERLEVREYVDARHDASPEGTSGVEEPSAQRSQLQRLIKLCACRRWAH
jgi:hypothetical protein